MHEIHKNFNPMEITNHTVPSTASSATDRDIDNGVHLTAFSESSLVDRVGNTDW